MDTMTDDETDWGDPDEKPPPRAAGDADHDADHDADGVLQGGTDEDTSGMLVRVRFGLGKELQLYPDELVVLQREARDELRLRLDSLKRMILAPGDQTPSKLVLLFDLDDGNTIIAAEGMTNVRDFRKLLDRLIEIKPDLELDPPNMDEQLVQALDVRRRSLIGCYGFLLAACVLVWVIYMVVAFIGARAHG
ncbi:MAG TPA: hypothetical protein VIG30_12850 [Ktedonobacterales bacterium]